MSCLILGEVYHSSSISIANIQTLERYIEAKLDEYEQNHGVVFTPEPIVNLMVEQLSPKLSDKILDPCCGCGAFILGLLDFYSKQKTKVKLKEIIISNLFAIDIQPQHVAITKVLIALYCLEKNILVAEDDLNKYPWVKPHGIR